MKVDIKCGTLCGIVANMLDFNIVLSKFELQSIHFRTNTLVKVMKLLS